MSREKARAAARRAVAEVPWEKGCVTIVEVLVAMGRLSTAGVEDWRFGRVAHLERVVDSSLGTLSAIGREVRAACEALGLESSLTAYRSWGRGPKRPLRFSRSREPTPVVDRLFHRIGAEVAAEIDCASCGSCGRQMSPVLLPKDVERLARTCTRGT